MTLVIEKVAATMVACLRGALDPAQAAQVEAELLAHIDKGERRFVLDLAGTTLVSPPGIRALLMLDQQLRHHDGRLVLCNLQGHVAAAFHTCGALALLTVTVTRAEAVALLA